MRGFYILIDDEKDEFRLFGDERKRNKLPTGFKRDRNPKRTPGMPTR
jgi:hypothetical protein